MGDSSEIGLYEVCWCGSLLGLGMGMMLAVFQMDGIVLVLMERLKVCVRSLVALGPRCCRCLMLIRSGPHELFVLLVLIASCVCSVVMVMVGCSSFRICLSVFRFDLSVVWGLGEVKCLLKAFAMSVSVCSGFLKLIVMFSCRFGRLFERD